MTKSTAPETLTQPLAPATCWIDGTAVLAPGDIHTIIDPFTERPMGSAAEAGSELVDRAVLSAAAAGESWRITPVDQRADLLERVADLLDSEAETLAALVTRQMGMPITLSRVTQAQLPARVLRATAAIARESFPWREETPDAVLLRAGAGVVGAITPWNMPVHQIIAKAAAAIVAGCSLVLKPSEQTPYDALRIAELFTAAGAPDGLFTVVTGTGPITGAALAGHPGLGRMSFTGSVGAGRAVAGLAAATLTPVALELGGKSPALLLPDAPLERAVPAAARSGLVNSGQACNATTRMVVPQIRFDEVAELAAQAVSELVFGDPTLDGTTHGPLVSAVQQQSVLTQVQRAIDQGGRLITGTAAAATHSSTGFFVDPVIISDLAPTATAVQEEIFGPVIVIQTYGDEAEAIRLANDTKYGLSAEVWSDDERLAQQAAARLSVGQVKINGVRTRDRVLAPFGGMGDSGYGRELGPLGIEEFTDVTAVMA